AYYFSSTQDDDVYYRLGGRNYVRVPAEEVIHGFISDIVGQKRGLPWMATSLYRMKMLHGFEDAALVNARVTASKMGFFEREEGYGPEEDEDYELTMDVEPGMYRELPPGVRVKEINPQYPNGELAVFSKSMLRGIASGLGVAYNNLANDLEGVNYSSIRQGTLDEREHWKDLQEWFIEALIEPVFEAWLPIALLSGRITVKDKPLKAERLDKYRIVEWQPRRWQWIDPRADVVAAVESKNNLLTSPGQIIRDQGRDPDAVWREIAADINQMREAGIPEEFIAAALGRKGDFKNDPNEKSSND
ncbi:phage portal protein, partial [bacterium]|nr:phage portal protein [bacterium]